ncbi:uncharacterized protein [Aegilops tauschii subsp. strangulata]|uniref:uncharacterized protein n=1 Tax=Aegilops tauschii subsp. strangulata TaxID=200361 RepID=UPI003CC856F3
MATSIVRGVQPLQFRGLPMWHYNGEDDASRCGRKGPDTLAALATILADLYKGEKEEFTRLKRREGFSMYNPPNWEWRKVIAGIHSPAPQPEDHNRDLDPGFEEDPDIFVELKEGVFYQASYDGPDVAIMADYPGLLPASYGRRSARHASSEASHKRTAPAPGGSSKRKANDDTAEPSSRRYGLKYAP